MASNSPPDVIEADAAAYDARHPGVDIPAARKAERWRRESQKLTPAEHDRYIAAGFHETHTPEPKTDTVNGVRYCIIDADYDRRWREGRVRASVAYASWLVQRARKVSTAACHARTSPRARGAGRPAGRGRRSSTSRDDGGSDSDPAGSSARPLRTGEAAS